MISESAVYAYLLECQPAIQTLVPTNKVGLVRKSGCTEVYAYSKAWPCLLPHTGPGPKHSRPIHLQPWQRYFAEEYARDLLRGLIHSDGCRFENTGRGGWRAPRYAFKNRSKR